MKTHHGRTRWGSPEEEGAAAVTHPEHPVRRRIALDDVPGDWLTVAEYAAWAGVSRNAAYEALRQEPMRAHVRRFGRQIRISKQALVRLRDGE